jgi:tRNA(Ile2) C34 agmatinyltransferase TiaS
MSDPSISPISPIERPRCPRCQLRMMLASREYLGNGAEKRTFRCAKCDLVETKIVDDPLKSSALARLADGVRPPS